MVDRPLAITRQLPRDPVRNLAAASRTQPAGPAGPSPMGGRPRHPLARPPAPPARRQDELGLGVAISAVLHTAALVLMLLGLPRLFTREPPQETVVAVQLVNPAALTRTTAVNPHPKAEAKPVPPPPIPAEKPLPPVVEPVVPPPAPPPPKSEPAPPPPEPLPKPEPKPIPPPPPIPVPVPEIKPDLPRPPPPKPEPPKQVAKVEPPKPTQKDDLDFDSLVKTLTRTPPQERNDQPPKPLRPLPPTRAASSLANAPLGSQISTSEKDLLAAAVSACWDVDPGAKGASQMRAVIQVEVDPDGTVRNTTILDSEGRGNDPVWRAFAERARRAPLIPQCNKLPIPAGKYEQLKVFTFTFTPQGVL
jgi:hypothetical protein